MTVPDDSELKILNENFKKVKYNDFEIRDNNRKEELLIENMVEKARIELEKLEDELIEKELKQDKE